MGDRSALNFNHAAPQALLIDVLPRIASFLPLKQLPHLSLVCKAWARVLASPLTSADRVEIYCKGLEYFDAATSYPGTLGGARPHDLTEQVTWLPPVEWLAARLPRLRSLYIQVPPVELALNDDASADDVRVHEVWEFMMEAGEQLQHVTSLRLESLVGDLGEAFPLEMQRQQYARKLPGVGVVVPLVFLINGAGAGAGPVQPLRRLYGRPMELHTWAGRLRALSLGGSASAEYCARYLLGACCLDGMSQLTRLELGLQRGGGHRSNVTGEGCVLPTSLGNLRGHLLHLAAEQLPDELGFPGVAVELTRLTCLCLGWQPQPTSSSWRARVEEGDPQGIPDLSGLSELRVLSLQQHGALDLEGNLGTGATALLPRSLQRVALHGFPQLHAALRGSPGVELHGKTREHFFCPMHAE